MTKSLTLLVAENVSSWREREVSALEKLGYTVISMSSSDEAIQYMEKHGEPDLIIHDLHMDDPKQNGVNTLKYLMNKKSKTAFVIATATLTKDAQKILKSKIPNLEWFIKTDFYNPEFIEKKLKDIYSTKRVHVSRKEYAEALEEVKSLMRNIPDILIHADRIKGNVLNIVEHFREKFMAINYEDKSLYEFLFKYDFTGESTPTSRGTPSEKAGYQLHELKGILELDFFKKKEPLNSIIKETVADIYDVINCPKDDEISLLEVVGMANENFRLLYPDVNVEVDIPADVEVSNAPTYFHAIRSLLHNAVQVAKNTDDPVVKVRYDEGVVWIRNKGNLPKDWLNNDGTPDLNKVQSLKEFGNGFGIPQCAKSLEEIGSRLYYNIEKDYVDTCIQVKAFSSTEQIMDKGGNKPKVLFVDMRRGSRLTGMEERIKVLEGCHPEFEYVWNPKMSIDQLKKMDYLNMFLTIFHPSSSPEYNNIIFQCGEQEHRNPHMRFGVISGDPYLSFYMYTRDRNVLGIQQKIWTDILAQQLPPAKKLGSIIASSYKRYVKSKK